MLSVLVHKSFTFCVNLTVQFGAKVQHLLNVFAHFNFCAAYVGANKRLRNSGEERRPVYSAAEASNISSVNSLT
jgi:hypothetical protein